MGAKGSKKKHTFKVMVVGVAGSGKSTFVKQMKILNGGFSNDEIDDYKGLMMHNVLGGMQELIKQCARLDVALEEKSLKHARALMAHSGFEDIKDEQFHKHILVLWADSSIQLVFKDRHRYQLSTVAHMDYLVANVERFSKPGFVPTNDDILYARQRTTGSNRTFIKQDKITWEMIDCGGQTGERKKWQTVIAEGLTAMIFFVGLDEYNMASAEDKTMTKMDVARQVFSEVVNSESTNGITKLLFLNKEDLFKQKMADKAQFAEFQRVFPEYKGDNSPEMAAEFVSKKFQSEIEDEHMHHHVICALDTNAMSVVFEAVKEDIFARKMAAANH